MEFKMKILKCNLIIGILSLLIACGGGGSSEDNTSVTNPPDIPTGLTCISISHTQIELTWNTPSDTGDSDPAGYIIYRDGLQIGTAVSSDYSDIGLTPNTEYTYTVSAYDNASNESSQSTPVYVKTNREPDIDGLIAHYSFDEGFGNIALDGTSNENHGVITAASRVEGKIGNGLLFGFDDSYIAIYDGLYFDNGLITIETWIKPDEMEAGEVYRIIGDYNYHGFYFQIRDGRLEILYEGQSYHYGSISILPNVWTHIAFISDGVNIVTYINGIEDARTNITLPIQNIFNIRIGAHRIYTGGNPLMDYIEEFPGIIDELRIWDGIRTLDEIYEYYDSTN